MSRINVVFKAGSGSPETITIIGSLVANPINNIATSSVATPTAPNPISPTGTHNGKSLFSWVSSDGAHANCFWSALDSDWEIGSNDELAADQAAIYDNAANVDLADVTAADWVAGGAPPLFSTNYSYSAGGGGDAHMATVGNWYQADGLTALGRLPTTTETLTFPNATPPDAEFAATPSFAGLDLTDFPGAWGTVAFANLTITANLQVAAGIFAGTYTGTNAAITGGVVTGAHLGDNCTFAAATAGNGTVFGASANINTTGATVGNITVGANTLIEGSGSAGTVAVAGGGTVILGSGADTVHTGNVTGSVIVNAGAYVGGNVSGDAAMNGSGYVTGTIGGNAIWASIAGAAHGPGSGVTGTLTMMSGCNLAGANFPTAPKPSNIIPQQWAND